VKVLRVSRNLGLYWGLGLAVIAYDIQDTHVGTSHIFEAKFSFHERCPDKVQIKVALKSCSLTFYQSIYLTILYLTISLSNVWLSLHISLPCTPTPAQSTHSRYLSVYQRSTHLLHLFTPPQILGTTRPLPGPQQIPSKRRPARHKREAGASGLRRLAPSSSAFCVSSWTFVPVQQVK